MVDWFTFIDIYDLDDYRRRYSEHSCRNVALERWFPWDFEFVRECGQDAAADCSCPDVDPRELGHVLSYIIESSK